MITFVVKGKWEDRSVEGGEACVSVTPTEGVVASVISTEGGVASVSVLPTEGGVASVPGRL